MEDTLTIVLTGIAGSIALLLSAAAAAFDPGNFDEDEEEEDEREVKISGVSGGGGGGGESGGNGHGGKHTSTEETLKAEFTSRPGSADVKIESDGPVPAKENTRKGATDTIRVKGNDQCTSCGAVNSDETTPCWNCGSKTGSTFGSGGLSKINEELREQTTRRMAYEVEKGEDVTEKPDLSFDEGSDTKEKKKEGTTDEDIRDKEKIPLHRWLAGKTIAWVGKWHALTKTHFRSMAIVTGIAMLIWGSTTAYGAIAFDTAGLLAMIGASAIAIVSASFAVLFHLSPGKWKTIILAYPFSLNVILLPPVVIAIYEPRLNIVLDQSTLFAEYLLQNYAAIIGIEQWLRNSFVLQGFNFILMWFLISIPVGIALGSIAHSTQATIRIVKSMHQKAIEDIQNNTGENKDDDNAPQ
jgi:hypothetical protein